MKSIQTLPILYKINIFKEIERKTYMTTFFMDLSIKNHIILSQNILSL